MGWGGGSDGHILLGLDVSPGSAACYLCDLKQAPHLCEPSLLHLENWDVDSKSLQGCEEGEAASVPCGSLLEMQTQVPTGSEPTFYYNLQVASAPTDLEHRLQDVCVCLRVYF